MPNNTLFNINLDATSDGEWLVGDVGSRHLLPADTDPLPYMALLNINSGQVVKVHSLLTPQS